MTERNAERERLIEILGNFPVWHSTLRERWFPEAVERLADHLLANGVVVPPVKVGDTIYLTVMGRPISQFVVASITKEPIPEIEFTIFCYGGVRLDMRDFGRIWFATREEAEKALERIEQE